MLFTFLILKLIGIHSPDIVCDAVYSGLEQLNAMRLAEGKRLAEDLNHKIDLVEQLICQIEERAPFVVDEYRQRLQERLQDLLGGDKLKPGEVRN